ncbi:hypothetical protein APHAL10511_003372 [Amanita phalloides]|nr:hypothetical protein APHAL10511_003372 [Amanita phalloides]
MKVLIVGAGIGGLSASALSSPPSPFASSKPTPSSLGARPLRLSPPPLSSALVLASRPTAPALYTLSRHPPRRTFPSAHSSTALIATQCAPPPGIRSASTLEGRNTAMAGLGQQWWLRRSEEGEGEEIEWGRKVVAVTELEAHQGVQIEYQDGSKDVVDLVIGADGVRSRVRESMFHGKYPAEYNGVIGVGSFIPVALLPPKLKQGLLDKDSDDGVVMTFGTKGMFGYSLCTPRDVPNEYIQTGPILQWWCSYEAPEPSYTSTRAKTTAEADAVKQELLKSYGSWKSPRDENNSDGVFKSIVELGCVSEEVKDTLTHHHTPVLMLPRYVVPRLLESYTTPTGRIILLGDAAHAMPPDGGQGASCAAEDAVVYALLVSKLLSLRAAEPVSEMPESVLRDAAKGYNELRMERVGKVLDEAKNRVDNKKEISTLGRWFRDLMIRLMCSLPESLSDCWYAYDGEKVVNDYVAHNI